MNQSNAGERTDEELVALALRDPEGKENRAAASELLGRYQRRVYVWCFRYAREPERALDLAQEVLMTAYRALHTFQGRSRFSTWLFIVARNRCLNAVTAPALLRDEEAEPDRIAAPISNPAELYERQMDEDRVRQLLMERLDDEEREVLWLRCFERMPVDEITRVMRLGSASGARGVLQRARRKLRQALEPLN